MLVGHSKRRRGRERFASAWVPCVAGVRPAGDLEPELVTGAETIRRRPQLNLHLDDAVRIGHCLPGREPYQRIADIGGPSARIDIAEPGEEVGVHNAGSHEQVGRHLANQLQVAAERRTGVGEDVRA